MRQPGKQRGMISIVLALLLPALLVSLALAVDAGYLMLQQSQLRNYANAGALSGAKSLSVLTNGCDQAKQDAMEVIKDASLEHFSCDDSDFYVVLKTDYQPILLGFAGFSSDDLVATARAGQNDSGHIVLLGEAGSP